MLTKIPIDAQNRIIDVPPKLMNGSVIPVVGRRPVTTAALINALIIILNEIANPNNWPYSSFARFAIIIPIMNSAKKSERTRIVPKRPNCSPKTENMKSP